MRPYAPLLLAIVSTVASYAPRAASSESDTKRACLASYEGGQRLKKRGALVRATGELTACAQSACPAAIRQECVGWLAETERAVPTVVLVARGPDGEDLTDVAVRANDAPLADRLSGGAIALDPGRYTLRFERPPLPAVARTIVLAEGEKARRVEVAFARPPVFAPPASAPASARASAWPWVFVGVGIAGLGGAAYLLYRGNAEASSLEACRPACDRDRAESARDTIVAGDVLLGVGAASILTGLGWMLFDRGDSPRARASLRAGIAPEGAVIGAGGGF
jgi:hypothetical protein